jgi:hypothetical protein
LVLGGLGAIAKETGRPAEGISHVSSGVSASARVSYGLCTRQYRNLSFREAWGPQTAARRDLRVDRSSQEAMPTSADGRKETTSI